MRFLTCANILISAILFSTVKGHKSVYARGVEYDDLFHRGEWVNHHLHRRYDSLSDLNTREIVQELEDRLFRRGLTAQEKLKAAENRGFPLVLKVENDLADIEAFRKAVQQHGSGAPSTSGHHESAPPSPVKDKPASPPAADKHTPAQPKAPTHQD